MKSLELSLNKRLLIVEFEIGQTMGDALEKLNTKKDLDIICTGSELTEDIAKGFSVIVRNSHNEQGFIDYKCEQDEIVYDPGFITALHSFISAIESKGYHWGENPVKHPNDFVVFPDSFRCWIDQEEAHNRAELRTFNPEKCLIFEIL